MMDPAAEQKIATAKQLKETGDQAFKEGDLKKALNFYHQSLMYVKGITRNTSEAMGSNNDPNAPKPRTPSDELEEKVYANMSMCHLKLENWARAIDTADKALKKNPENYKAMFRKGKALGSQGYFEKAEVVLEELRKKNPADDAAVTAELKRIQVKEKEETKKHNQKMKGWLAREKTADAGESKIEEVEEISSPATKAAAS